MTIKDIIKVLRGNASFCLSDIFFFFEGVICIRDVEKIVRMFKKSVLLVKDGTAQVLKNTRNSFNKG